MSLQNILTIIMPFAGTALGAACVFLLKDGIKPKLQRALLGFAAGVMTSAAVWSLIIPSIDMSENMGRLAFFPAVSGILIGMGFLLLWDKIIPHMHLTGQKEGIRTSLGKSTMLFFAVTLHNIPEGIAVGVALAGASEGIGISLASAIALALGIAIQNFPEGAVISMPLVSEGMSKKKAFIFGALSGLAEPVAAVITIGISSHIIGFLPYLLSFAAGAMLYVVVEELIPESAEGSHSNIGTIGFALGFVLMIILDILIG